MFAGWRLEDKGALHNEIYVAVFDLSKVSFNENARVCHMLGFFFILAYKVSIKKESHVFMKLAIWIILMMPHNNYSLVKYGASELKINMMEISCLKKVFVKYKEIRLKSSKCFPCFTDMYINPTRLHS